MSSISTLQGAQEVSVTSSDILNVGGDQINNQPQAYSATASITVQAVSPDGHPLANPWTLDPFPIPAPYDPREGYPLWFLEPCPGVPSAYCATGVRIGDVGIVQSNKRFDYLFNICHRADDPINKYGVPDGFSTISYDEVELSFSAEDIYRKPGSPVTMPGSIKLEPITNGAVRNYTKYDEFQKVTLGSMFMMKSLGFRKLPKWDWEQQNGELVGQQRSSVQRTIYTTKIAGQQSKFTAIIYYGNDAQDSWEKDFQQFSHTHNPQLFGINQSAIPALIFHDELILCAQFFTGSFWMNVYIQYLAKNMGCQLYQLWMNTTSGVLFSGPDGPDFPLSYSNPVKSIVVPATIDMLKDDVSFRFFSKFGSHMDNDMLSCALRSYKFTSLFLQMAQDQSKDADHPDWSLVMPHYLHGLSQNHPNHPLMNVIGGLQFNTVYSPSLETAVRRPQEAGSLWWKMDGLVDRTELNGGLTCFKLDPVQRRHVFLEAEYNWSRFHREWLSQSSWVFNALDVTEGKEKFFIVLLPKLSLQSTQHPPAIPTLCNAEHPVEETPPAPIYLFLHPLPTMISELVSWTERPCYFWSFDETGQSQMSEEECEQWGLPVLTFNIGHPSQVQLFSWPTHVYIGLQDWQGARGFDPTTSDWARSMGYPEWEIIGTRAVDRFVLIEETSYKSETSDED
ncbi:hypothetical protein Moror_11804 [Moniliophthora roreri MCA 2997]|uniref:Uncharacterized protein n=1 Tax=Moniliophthora roreri (strain MCA 2997) TaxID=1381753 RepID=V2W810_MONRO|nr:hypothetical protein Moror_11804 [Moniliophthora roreri MCA 2997]